MIVHRWSLVLQREEADIVRVRMALVQQIAFNFKKQMSVTFPVQFLFNID